MRLRTHIAIAAALLAVGTTRLPAQTSWNLIGPHAGDVRCIATNAGGQMLIGGDGIFLSTDSAAHWRPTSIQLRQPVQPCETYDQVRSIVRTASGTLIAGVSWFHGAFRSTDSGATWALDTSGLSKRPGAVPIEALVRTAGNVVYAATGFGIYRTTNEGDLWTSCSPGLTDTSFVSIAECANGALLAGTRGGIYRSTDSGATWAPSHPSPAPAEASLLFVAASGSVFTGTGNGLFLSTDHGATWSAVTSIPSTVRVTCIHPFSTSELIAGTVAHGIYRSTDGGLQWSQHSNGPGRHIRTFHAGATGVLLAGTTEGLFRSTDQGQSWSRAQFTAATVYDMAVLTTGHVFAATDYGLYRTTDQGFTWTQLRDGMFRSVAASAAGRVYGGTGTCDAGVLRWTAFGNVGGSGTQVLTNLVDAIVSCIGLSASGTVYADHYQLTKRSGDHGATWSAAAPSHLQSFATNGGSTHYLAGQVSTTHHLHRTTDDGATWTSIHPVGYGGVVAIALDAQNRLHAATDAHLVLTSTNGGSTWSRLPAAVPDEPLGIAVHPGGIFVGTTDGLYRSTDSGATWMREQNGLPPTGTKSMKVDGSGNAYVGFHKGGVYRAALPVPVALSTFTAEATGPDVQLAWTTETERNNRGFDVQRRRTSTGTWETTVFIPAAGTSTGPCRYAHLDRNPGAGHHAYRLRQIDHDGTEEYSHVVEVEIQSRQPHWSLDPLHPNPASDAVTITFTAPEECPVHVTLCDMLGRGVTTLHRDTAHRGTNTVRASLGAPPPGMYVIALETPGTRLSRILAVTR